MNERGEIVCGLHGRPWCPECSDAERRRLQEVQEELEGAAAATPKKPSWHDGERIRRELASLGLGRKARRR